jgi:hypothetical protein
MTKRHMPWIAAVVLVVAVAAIAGPPLWRWAAGPPAGYCPICLRREHKESMVKFQAEGERVTQACCLSCALTYGRQAHKKVTILSVTDMVLVTKSMPGRIMVRVVDRDGQHLGGREAPARTSIRLHDQRTRRIALAVVV